MPHELPHHVIKCGTENTSVYLASFYINFIVGSLTESISLGCVVLWFLLPLYMILLPDDSYVC